MKTIGSYGRNAIGKLRAKLTSIQADPRPVCLGYALGIFLATTPFVGLKVFIALFLTWMLHWNKVASVIGVLHVNLATGPVFYALAFFAGKIVTGTDLQFDAANGLSLATLYNMLTGSFQVFWSLLIGGVVLGIPLTIGAYYLARYLLRHTPRPTLRVVPNSPGEPDYTLITGASTGLGRELALECARQGRNLLLVSLPNEGLGKFCSSLEQEYGITARAFETDLTCRDSIQALALQILPRYRVDFLINNAGIGGSHSFEDSSLDDLDRIILLNIRAVSLLTRLMVPELKRHPRAFILNVSSMAAFSPIPYKTVYPASKAFVYSFSRSLNQELRGTSVRVSVLHPGPIMTNPDVIRRIIRQGRAGRVGLLPASRIAHITLHAIRHNRTVIIPGIANKLNLLVIRIVPLWIRLQFLSKVIRREIEEPLRMAA